MNTKLSVKKVVGIDLGTTNSVVAILEGANPLVIPNGEGFRTTPSVVAFSTRGETLVGELAKRQSVINPENTFYSVKRFIGCKYDEIKEETSKISYKVKSADDGKVKIECPALEKDFTPEEISALVLKKLVRDASRFLDETITQAIITVPAYFNDSQRLATKDAGAIAGLEVLRILNEPTAAALAYGLDKKKNEVVLIFDLGGGTFDVSILEVGEEVFEVLATSGDTHLGGDDFDRAIVDFIMQDFKRKHNIDLYKDKQAHQRIIEVAEKVKIELSTLQSTIISIPFIYLDSQGTKDINIPFDRSQFETLCKNLLEKCKDPVQKALNDAKMSKSDIDQVILVGGSTRIPAVRNLLNDLLSKPLNETVNPDEVVAMGAAVQAGIIAGEITDLILLDVTPLSLGVETIGGLMTTIINRNASIPVKQSEIFSTSVDNQDAVEVHVLQGERPFAKDNKSLGIFILKGIPSAPRGIPKINVTFQLDVDGLLSVSAREEKSGIEQSIKIEGASVLEREEVSKLIKEAEINSVIDSAKKVYTDLSYQVDNLILSSDEVIDSEISKKTEALIGIEKTLALIEDAYSKDLITYIFEDLLSKLEYFCFIGSAEAIVENLINSNSKNKKNNIIEIDSDDINVDDLDLDGSDGS